MRSLRTRLLFGIICGTLLLLLIFSLTVYIVIRRALFNQYDSSLASMARMLAASVESDEDKFELEFDIRQIPEFLRKDQPTYYQLRRSDGSDITKSPLLGTDDIILNEGPINTLVFTTSRVGKGETLRVVCLKFIPRFSDSDHKEQPRQTEDQAITLAVARDAGDLMSQLRFLRWLLLIASAAVITLSLLISAIVVRQGLGPLNSIAGEIAAIREENLTKRIGAEPTPSEVVPIKDRLNDLLSRLEAAFKRERRFTADVAHELRTPLAGIRSTIEVSLSRARDSSEYKKSLSDCLEIVENMQTMVNNLLTLARLDAHQTAFRREQIRPGELVNSCWRLFSEKARERNITFENRITNELTFVSDRENLSMVMSNLLDNAVEYTNRNGRIWTAASKGDNTVEVTVANTPCSLTVEQVSQVFDCFGRADSSRSETGAHCGLGLALVQRIIKALGGDATSELQNGNIFTIRLVLPVGNILS